MPTIRRNLKLIAMIYKMTLSVSGEDFYPLKIKDYLLGDFLVVSVFSPNDKKFDDQPDLYGFGGMSFWHPQKFALQGSLVEYEKIFVEFLVDNYQRLTDNGAQDFDIFIEVYYDGGQCNFEIFNKSSIAKLASFGVSIPVSVYLLEQKEFESWANEIRTNMKKLKNY